jgi:hypothetical protein
MQSIVNGTARLLSCYKLHLRKTLQVPSLEMRSTLPGPGGIMPLPESMHDLLLSGAAMHTCCRASLASETANFA